MSVSGIAAPTTNQLHFLQGRFFSGGGTINIAAAAAGYIQVLNPTGSGKNIMVTNFTVTTSVNGTVEFWTGNVLDTPTAMSPFNPNRAYAAATSAVTLQKASAVTTTGTKFSPVYRTLANRIVDKDFTFLLTPGQSVEVKASTALLESMDFYATSTWIETPV